MANIVDELVVKLGLDNTDFKRGAKESEGQLNKVKGTASTTAKNLQEQGKKGAEFFTQLQKTALKFFGVLAVGTAGFRAFANLISSGAHLSRLATNLGTSANSLHKWGQAVKQSGGTAAGFEKTIAGLSAEITAWKYSGEAGPMITGLQKLGVGLEDAQGQAKSLETIMFDLYDALRIQVPNRADRVNIASQFGFDEGLINLMERGRKEAEALINSQPGMDDAAAKKAQEINEKWEALVERVRGKVRQMAVDYFPLIERAVTAVSNAFDKMQPIIDGFVTGFTKLNEITDGWLGNILMALGALKLVKGLLPGGAAAATGGAAAGIGAGGLLATAGAGYAGYKAGEVLYDKGIAGTSLGDTIGKGVAKVMAFFGNKNAQEALDANERSKRVLGGQEVSGRVTPFNGGKSSVNQAAGNTSSVPSDLQAKLAEAEKANGLPSGILSSIIKQETGGNQKYLDDPSKYHYDLNANGQRIAGHTGKVSTAFGPFGLLESTAAKPGYGVKPLQDKSIDEQIRFAAQYLAGRAKSAGSMFAGLSGYGEGAKYANQVLGRLSGGTMSGLSVAGFGGNSSSGTAVTIGKVEIQTAATDAAGIARSFKDELVRTMNYGSR